MSPGSLPYGSSLYSDACGRGRCRHHRADHMDGACWLCGCSRFVRTDSAGIRKGGVTSAIAWVLVALTSAALVCGLVAITLAAIRSM